jgi:hypothetical protein
MSLRRRITLAALLTMSLGPPVQAGSEKTISIIKNMAPESPRDHLPPCNAPMNDSRPLPSNWPCVGFQPRIVPSSSRPLAVPPTPQDSFRSGTQLLRQGKIDQAVMDLEFAAEQGVPGALWKLGRMYADGDGVKLNKARAYEYFRRLTTMHAADSAGTPNARFLANAFVTLGLYYQEGIPGTLKADPNHAREMFQFAASYFADPEAQYHLAKLYLAGSGAPKNAMTAARWLQLSAEKGDHRAQAVLGSMLFKGEQVPRQAARGLAWLIIAKDGAGTDETWITDMYTSAIAQASDSDKAMAKKYLLDRLKRGRE